MMMKFLTPLFVCLVVVVESRPPLIPQGMEHLPEEAKDKLIQYHFNKDLTFEQRRDKIEDVLDELPKTVLEKMPLPPGLERLPEEKKKPFKDLHMNRDLDWRERQQLVRQAINELPEHEQRLVEPPRPPMPSKFEAGQGFQQGFPMGPPPAFAQQGFPPHPPPGFEIIGPTLYNQLMSIHQNGQLSPEHKKQQINRIMQRVPQEQLDRLPLPPHFDRLSAENQQRVRNLMHNFQLDWDERHEAVKEFIRGLPRDQRALLRPPTPMGVEMPEEIQDQIDELFMDEKLSPMERHGRLQALMQKLPAEVRAKLPPPLPFMQGGQGKSGDDETVRA